MKERVLKLIILAVSLFVFMVSQPISEISASTVEKINLDCNGMTMYKGSSAQLTAKVIKLQDKEIKWSSSNKKVIKVNGNGKVKAVGAGTAFVKAVSISNKEKYAKCKITVIIDDSKDIKCTKFPIPDQSAEPNDKTMWDIKEQKISSYNQLKEVIKEIEQISKSEYVLQSSTGYGEMYDGMLKALKGYKKSYFSKNVLYLKRFSSNYPIQVVKTERVIMKTGKYKLRITVRRRLDPPGTSYFPEFSRPTFIVAETSKSIANTIEQVQLKEMDVKENFLLYYFIKNRINRNNYLSIVQ